MLKPSITDPSAAQFGNQLFVFTVGDDNHIQTSMWMDGQNGWFKAKLTGAGGAVPTAPAAKSNVSPLVTAGYLHCFYRDVNNYIQNIFCINNVWGIIPITGPGITGSPIASGAPVAAAVGGYLNCFFKDTQGNIWKSEATPTGWVLSKTCNMAMKPAGKISVASNLASTHVFYRGEDNHLWAVYSADGKKWFNGKVNDDILTCDPFGIGEINMKDPITRYKLPQSVVYTVANGQVNLCVWRENDGWRTYAMNGTNGTTSAPAAASDVYMANQINNYLCFYYNDGKGNLVTIAASSFDTRKKNSGLDNFVNFFTDDIGDGFKAWGNSTAIFFKDFGNMMFKAFTGDAKDASFMDITDPYAGVGNHSSDNGIVNDYSYMKVVGPTSFYDAMPPIQGIPAIIAMDKNIHLFYRDNANKVIDLLTHFDGKKSSNAACYV